MKYLLIIIILIATNAFAEIVELAPGVRIKIPEDKTYIKYNKLENMLKNFLDAEFTDKETTRFLNSSKISGSSGDEIAVHINSRKVFKYQENKKDDFGILENESMIDDAIFACMGKFKTKKKEYHCYYRNFKIITESTSHYNLWINENEDLKFKELFTLTDDEIANLSRKEIKKINKKYSPKFKFKSKSKKIKYSGSQNIKITGTGDFYIEEMINIVKYGLFKTTFVSFNIPYKNRRFVIFAVCVDEFCDGIRQKMVDIIEPTFKINPNGIKTYDFQKKQNMIDLITKVKNGYRIFRLAELLMFLV